MVIQALHFTYHIRGKKFLLRLPINLALLISDSLLNLFTVFLADKNIQNKMIFRLVEKNAIELKSSVLKILKCNANIKLYSLSRWIIIEFLQNQNANECTLIQSHLNSYSNNSRYKCLSRQDECVYMVGNWLHHNLYKLILCNYLFSTQTQ